MSKNIGKQLGMTYNKEILLSNNHNDLVNCVDAIISKNKENFTADTSTSKFIKLEEIYNKHFKNVITHNNDNTNINDNINNNDNIKTLTKINKPSKSIKTIKSIKPLKSINNTKQNKEAVKTSPVNKC